MNDSKDTGFRSYILDESDLESITLNDSQHTKLLYGETLVVEGQKVMMFAPLSDHKKGTLGVLSVTTFKLSFVAGNEKDQRGDECYQRNLLLGPFEVCLSSIDTVYQVGERSKKKLLPGQNISSKVKELLIICKNMRVLEFSFKFADKDTGRNIANAILHHAYPKRHSLLFAYDFKEPYYKTIKDVRAFRRVEDWKRELLRTGTKNWRVSHTNQNFHLSPSLPQALVVPVSVTDSSLNQAVEHFRNRYCPIWVWGCTDRAALVRMADILPTISDRTQENIMLEHVRKSHSEKRQPYILDLGKDCPTTKEIQSSYVKLRELCIPESMRVFKSQDLKFYGMLDNSKWLHHVSTCLTQATLAATEMSQPNPCTVVLQEGNGQDMNCVISSLIQLILDSHWRTVSGFQSLIQKEWVALGHPFAYRLGHVFNQEVEICPIFLLFLDCVWQLLQQFPTAFQFTETYLATVWDSAFVTVFDTFLFNCEHDRFLVQTSPNPLILRSVWDWKEQFAEKNILLFCNPLYDDAYTSNLTPNTTLPFLDIWTLCYFRWLPDLEIKNGGKPQIDLCNRFIASEIHFLNQQLHNSDVTASLNGPREENVQLLRKIDSFFPFSYNNGQIHGKLNINNSLLSSDSLDSQSILNHSAAND